jgi:hypothetical protein
VSRNKDTGRPELDVDVQAGDEAFLSRWSRRKTESRQQIAPAAPVPDETNSSAAVSSADEELPTDADLPDLDSLTEDSDYQGFMSPRVSEELRKMALRKLFHASAFNVRDGLDDYDDDFTSFTKLGDVITADMKHHAQRIAEKMSEKRNTGESPDDSETALLAGDTDITESDQNMAEAANEGEAPANEDTAAKNTNEDLA